MNPPLPIELQRLVIAHLWEDPDTLAVCSLVSSQWFEPSRTLHFSSFKLQLRGLYPTPKEATKYQELKTLLQAPRSRLRPYIRQLELRGSSWRVRSPDEPINLYSDFSSELLSILPLLTCVTDLTLMAISWSKLLPDAKHAIQSLSGVDSLSCILCSGSVDDLISLSDCFAQLQTLVISQLQETTHGTSTLSLESKTFRRLRILKLMDSAQSAVRLLKAGLFLPSPTLTGLTLHIYDDNCWGDVPSILRAVAPTLADLSLAVQVRNLPTNLIFATAQEIERERPDFSVSLASNTNLKTVAFISPGEEDMWWIELILNTISDEHKLEKIKFSISPFTDRPPSSMENVLLRVVKPTTRVIWECYDTSFKFMRPATVTEAMPELTKRGQLWANYHTLQDPQEKIWNRVAFSTVTKRLCFEE
ncbi:hypothetical protein H0H93_004781 [Arthromyces matolae]|nr:hypothetical protein H0H93_004781 [Arthromyces matolae]